MTVARWRARSSGVVAEIPDGVDPGAAWERLDGGEPPAEHEPPPQPDPEAAGRGEEPEAGGGPAGPEAPEPTAAEIRGRLAERGLRWRRGWTKADALRALEGGGDGD